MPKSTLLALHVHFASLFSSSRLARVCNGTRDGLRLSCRLSLIYGFTAMALIVAAVTASRESSAGISFKELAEQTHLHGLAVNPNNSSELLISTHSGIFTLSKDGRVERVSETGDDFMSLTPHPSDRSVLFASGHPTGSGNLGFVESRDGGRSWKMLSKGAVGIADFHSLDVSKADPSVIYGIYGGFQVSRDGGLTWRLVGPLLDRIMDIAASSVDPDTVYGATYDGLILTRDGGVTWQSTKLPKKPISVVRAAHNGSVYAFVVGIGLMRNLEPSPNWELMSPQKGQRIIGLLAFDPANAEHFYAVTHQNEVLESLDGGRTWLSLWPE